MADSVQMATLKRALALAGDVLELSLRVGPGANSLLAMLNGNAEIPAWVFLRAVDYVNEQEEASQLFPASGLWDGIGASRH